MMPLAYDLKDSDGGGRGDVEAIFIAESRETDHRIAEVDDIGVDADELVAEDERERRRIIIIVGNGGVEDRF